MTMEIIIEQLKSVSESQVYEINELLKQLNPDSRIIDINAIKEMIEVPENRLFVAREKVTNKIVGMLTLIIIKTLFSKKGMFEDIVVDKDYRGKGIAAKLISSGIDQARKEELKRIDLTSSPARVAANDLYPRLGFVKRDTNVYRMEL
jgi:ribosomal protein S18 acetylase RimI-like enzyme